MNFDFLEEKEFVVDIENCDKNKEYLTAYVHIPNQYMYSFRVTVAPHLLCYYGDVGTFVFKTNESFSLGFFNDKTNEGYWEEKLLIKNAREFDSQTLQRNLLEELVDYFDISEEDFSDEDIDKINIDKMRNLIEEYHEEYLESFDLMIDYSFEEHDLGNFYDEYYHMFEDCCISAERYTSQYLLCCKNLSEYSQKIIDKADEYLKENGK